MPPIVKWICFFLSMFIFTPLVLYIIFGVSFTYTYPETEIHKGLTQAFILLALISSFFLHLLPFAVNRARRFFKSF